MVTSAGRGLRKVPTSTRSLTGAGSETGEKDTDDRRTVHEGEERKKTIKTRGRKSEVTGRLRWGSMKIPNTKRRREQTSVDKGGDSSPRWGEKGKMNNALRKPSRSRIFWSSREQRQSGGNICLDSLETLRRKVDDFFDAWRTEGKSREDDHGNREGGPPTKILHLKKRAGATAADRGSRGGAKKANHYGASRWTQAIRRSGERTADPDLD